MKSELSHRPRDGTPRDLTLPATALSALWSSLYRQAGSPAATQALHAAGHESGVALFEKLDRGARGPLAELGEGAFWEHMEETFRRGGWGTLRHRRIHSGLGLLSTSDWAEAEAGHDDGHPGCAFTSGLFVGFLGRVAGGPLAVLEVGCRTRGDGECHFAFGSERAIHELYGLLLDGVDLQRALEQL